MRLFLFAPASGAVEELELPESMPHCRLCDVQEHRWNGSLLRRDPTGCIWLLTHDDAGETYLRLDTATREVTVALEHRRGDGSYYRLLGWPDAHHVLVSQDHRILRFDLRTRERTVLFPKESR